MDYKINSDFHHYGLNIVLICCIFRFLMAAYVGDKMMATVECTNKKDGRKEVADKAMRILIAAGEYNANVCVSKIFKEYVQFLSRLSYNLVWGSLSVTCSKPGYASITCSKIEHIPYNLFLTTNFIVSSILITIISWNYLNLSLPNEYVCDVTIPTQVSKYNQCCSRRISQSDCRFTSNLIINKNVLKIWM